MIQRLAAVTLLTVGYLPIIARSQTPSPLMPIDLANSAEAAWLRKPVLATRTLDDMSDTRTWRFQGTAKLSQIRRDNQISRPAFRVTMDMFPDKPAMIPDA